MRPLCAVLIFHIGGPFLRHAAVEGHVPGSGSIATHSLSTSPVFHFVHAVVVLKLPGGLHFTLTGNGESDLIHGPSHLLSISIGWRHIVWVVGLRAGPTVIPVVTLHPHPAIITGGKTAIRVSTISPVLRLHHLRAGRISTVVIMLPATVVTEFIINIIIIIAPSIVVAAIAATGHEHHPCGSFHLDPSLRRRGGSSAPVNAGEVVAGGAAGSA